jgi:hypothetical protein
VHFSLNRMAYMLLCHMSYTLCYLDRRCMYSDSISAKFVEITNSFLKTIMGYMENNVWGDKYIQCPRVDYKNQKQFQNIEHIH